MAIRGFESTVSVSTLGPDHFAIFKQGLRNILSTELTEFTMAQLVDGLPTIDTYRENRSARNLVGDHPIKSHEHLCEGAIERTREFRDSFDPSVLEIKSSVSLRNHACNFVVVNWSLLTKSASLCKLFKTLCLEVASLICA